MASAQVLRRQEHLQAGKKTLEEFRKRRTAERSKKATSNNQPHGSDGGLKNQPLENENTSITDSRGAGTSDATKDDVKHDFVKPDLVRESDSTSSYEANASSNHSLYNNGNDASTASTGDNVFKGDENTNFYKQFSGNYDSSEKSDNYGASRSVEFGFNTGHSTANFMSSAPSYDNISSQFTQDSLGKSIQEGNNRKDLSVIDIGTSHVVPATVSPENPLGPDLQEKPGYMDRWTSGLTSSSYEGKNRKDLSVVDIGTSRAAPAIVSPETSLGPHLQEKPGYMDRWSSGLTSSSYEDYMHHARSSTTFSLEVGQKDGAAESNSSEARSFSSYSELPVPTVGRRSRPSFLDSITISKVPAVSSSPTESALANSFASKVHPMDTLESTDSMKMMDSSTFPANGSNQLNHHTEKDMGNMDNQYQLYAQKQKEDFAALEQHIEDLTQEKFSSQRALEASRALAESLTSENSALTESFNQQGSYVTQLKADMEKLQEEIKAQLVELEAVRMAYANIQLECNAADERAKLLASEVIGLEEKALRLRSNELKLERELEKSQAEISSFKKKMASLEKDRQDLLSTIDALKEEKKLLQVKLRKASGSGKSLDVTRGMPSQKDVSTSTVDLCDDEIVNTNTMDDPNLGAQSIDGAPYLPENDQLSLESLSMVVPPDQIRMIQNINTLISELVLEKEELVKALSLESSQCSKLQELNKDLTRKLEVQTQRLELLTAQSMASGNNHVRQPDALSVHDGTTYADEGDEVVERVLGWMMKLFPGGPSRRRTSRLV